MLIRLTPDQVSGRWTALGQAIIGAFENNEGAAPTANQTLQWLMEGKLQCWVNSSAEGKVDGILTTCFVPNTPFDTYSLLIFSLWASKKDGRIGEWEEGLKALKTFARNNGAKEILFFTKTPSVKKFGRQLKADEKTCFKVEV